MASILPSRRDMWLEKEPAGSAARERGWRAASTWVKCGANSVIPFIVSNLGLLSGRTFARPEGLTSVR
jgi:hypothetical protein